VLKSELSKKLFVHLLGKSFKMELEFIMFFVRKFDLDVVVCLIVVILSGRLVSSLELGIFVTDTLS